MATIPYTTLNLIKQYGDAIATKDDALITGLITVFSTAIERNISQRFSANTVIHYGTNNYYSAVIDRDGMLTFYPDINPINTVTALQYRIRGTGFGANNWAYIDPTQLDINNQDSGPVVRCGYPDFSSFRNLNVQVQVNLAGGYTDASTLPPDLEFACRRLVWWAYKQKSAPMDRTAIPELGQIIIPGSWPSDVKTLLDPFRCYNRH